MKKARWNNDGSISYDLQIIDLEKNIEKMPFKSADLNGLAKVKLKLKRFDFKENKPGISVFFSYALRIIDWYIDIEAILARPGGFINSSWS